MSTQSYPPLGAEMWEKAMNEMRVWALDIKDRLVKDLTINGRPPGTAEKSAVEQYHTLVDMKLQGDPIFIMNPEAQQELDRLSKQFGPVDQFSNPFAGRMPQQ